MTTTINNEHKKLNVPNLRFPEFQGEWEEYRIEDITENISSGKCKSHSSNGEYNLYGSTGIIGKTDEACYEGNLVLVARVGANAGFLQIINEPCGITDNTLIIKPQKVGAQYIYYYLQHFNLNRLIFGSGQPLITGGMLKKVKVSLGNIQEQNKLTRLLSLLDERIATQNKIIDKLQSLIKGIGKQLFMDNQNWRTVKIGELLRIGNGKDYKHLSIGKIPVYGTGGQMLLVNDYLYDGESVCIGRKGTIDTPMFLKGKFWTVDTLFYTYDFKDVLPKFCYYLFLQINWKLYNEGTGVPSLSKSTIENIKVKIPSLEQQQKICSILDCYEHKTNNEEQILELYHSEKQYLLRQMFI